MSAWAFLKFMLQKMVSWRDYTITLVFFSILSLCKEFTTFWSYYFLTFSSSAARRKGWSRKESVRVNISLYYVSHMFPFIPHNAVRKICPSEWENGDINLHLNVTFFSLCHCYRLYRPLDTCLLVVKQILREVFSSSAFVQHRTTVQPTCASTACMARGLVSGRADIKMIFFSGQVFLSALTKSLKQLSPN